MFFFHPLELYLETADLLVELGNQLRILLLPGAGPGAPEDLGQVLYQLLLPPPDDIWDEANTCAPTR